MHKCRKDRDSGFTMIELILVVVVLGVLTAIAIPSYGAIQRQARVAAVTEANHNALTEYRADEAAGRLTVGTKIDYYDYHKDGDSIWSRVTAYHSAAWVQATIDQPGYTGGFEQYADGVTCVSSRLYSNTVAEVARISGPAVCKYIGGERG